MTAHLSFSTCAANSNNNNNSEVCFLPNPTGREEKRTRLVIVSASGSKRESCFSSFIAKPVVCAYVGHRYKAHRTWHITRPSPRMSVYWIAGRSAPDFPYPSHRDAATLACRDWRLSLKAAWEPGYARLFRFQHKIYILAQRGLQGRLVVSSTIPLPIFWATHRQQCCCSTVGEERLAESRHEVEKDQGKEDSKMAWLRVSCRTVVCMCHGLNHMSPFLDLSQEESDMEQVRKMHEVAQYSYCTHASMHIGQRGGTRIDWTS